jgi:hypothetical protein
MPNPTTKKKAERDLAEGKSASTAAGEFVREEMHHIREGKHGAKNTKQAIAIGLSEARRAGIPAKPRPAAREQTHAKAAREGSRARKKPNPKRARASLRALEKEPRAAASRKALSRQAEVSAKRRKASKG